MQSAEKVRITMTPEMMRVARESVDAGEYTSIRARVRRSLDDPRPSLSADEAEAEMDRFMEEQEKAFSDRTR